MKVLMYLDNNHCVPVDAVIKPGLTEEEFVKAWNKAQPGMVHKVVAVEYLK